MKKNHADFLFLVLLLLLCSALVVLAVWLYVHGQYVAGAVLLVFAFGAAFLGASTGQLPPAKAGGS